MRFSTLLSLVFSAAALASSGEEPAAPKPFLEIAEAEAMVIERVPFQLASEVVGLAWSPDSRSIVACGSGMDITIWSASGLMLKTWNSGRILPRAIAWSPGGEYIVAGYLGGAVVWDSKTGTEVREIVHEDGVQALAFVPGTSKLVSAGDAGEINLTDLAGSGEPVRLPSPCRTVLALAFSNDGDRLLVGGREPPAALLSLSKSEILQRYSADYPDTATWVAWSERKDRIFVRLEKKPILEYDIASGDHLKSHDRFWIDSAAAIDRVPETDDLVAMFESGYTLRGNARRIGVDWSRDIRTGGLPLAAVSPNGRLVALRWSKEQIVITDAARGEVQAGGDGPIRPRYLAWSPDGKTLFASRGATEVHAFEAATGKRQRGFVAPGNRLLGLASREDGALIAASFDGAWLRVTDLTNAHDLVREALPKMPAYASLSDDGSTFVWWQDNVLRVRDLVAGKELPSIAILAEPTAAHATLSPRGDVLIQFGTERNRVVYYDTTTGTVLREMPYGSTLNPTAGVLSQDGSLTALFSPWNRVQVCFSGQKYPVELNFGGSKLEGVRFAPEGRRVAFLDTGAHVFDVMRTEALGQWWCNSPALRLAWSPDGRFLATLHKDGGTRIWDIPSPVPPDGTSPRDPILDWGDLSCQRADRAFEAAERLERGGAETAALLREKLGERENQPHIRDLLVQLGDESFLRRQSAREELHWLGVQAEPEILRAMAGQPPGAWRNELEAILRLAESRVGPSSQNLRRQRAMQVLEGIGSAEATDVLRHLSSESPSPRERADAQDALRRIELRSAK